MFRFSVSNLVKFTIGILLAQGVTLLLAYTALKTDLYTTWPFFGLLGLAVGTLTALWFTSIASSANKQALARAQELFWREREKIRLRAEQEKAKEVQNTHRQLTKENRRAQRVSYLRTGTFVIGGAVGLGAVMMLSQFVTLGLLTLTTAGGAALGYGVRARQERVALRKLRRLEDVKPIQTIEAKPDAPAIEDARKLPEVIREG
jgi:hypothetical protein